MASEGQQKLVDDSFAQQEVHPQEDWCVFSAVVVGLLTSTCWIRLAQQSSAEVLSDRPKHRGVRLSLAGGLSTRQRHTGDERAMDDRHRDAE